MGGRGEGWGRPHVEAMAMAKPVIATNWSGPTAFLDESCGYPLRYDGLVEVFWNACPGVGLRFWLGRGLQCGSIACVVQAELVSHLYAAP